MAYELFDNKAAKFGSPQITIRSGRIAFNADAGDILAHVGKPYAHLLWDNEVRKLALQPVDRSDVSTFKLTIPKGKRGGSFSAQSFLNYIGWHATEPVVVEARWNAQEQLLEATLPTENVGINAVIRKGLGFQ